MKQTVGSEHGSARSMQAGSLYAEAARLCVTGALPVRTGPPDDVERASVLPLVDEPRPPRSGAQIIPMAPSLLSSLHVSSIMIRRRLAVLLLLVTATATSVHAQEVQVPLDPDSTVYVVDAELEQSLDLFPEVDGFQDAVLYRTPDGAFELVIQYRENGRTLRRRRSLSADEVAALRERVSRQIADTGTRVNLNQEGRVDLLTATTLLGIAQGGLIAGAFADEDDGSLIATLPLLGGGLGFFVPLVATRNTRVTEGAAALAGYGGLQGYAHAVEIVGLVGGDDADGRFTSGFAALLGATESALGYRLGHRRGWSGGTAEMVAYTGSLGNLIGLGTGLLVVGSDDDVEGAFDAGDRIRVISGLSLLGSVGGMWAGHRLAQTERYTEGDARIYLNAGLLGTQFGGALLAATDSPSESPRFVAGTLLVSTIGGLATGARLLRGRDFDKSAGNVITLGTYAGSLAGSALAAAADTDEGGGFLLSTIGSAVGFGLSVGLFAKDAARRASSATSSVDLQVRPSLHTPRRADGSPSSWTHSLRPGLTLRASF